MPQGNFAAYSPQEQIAAARQLLASRGLPINADNLNRAMHALYTNSDFVPPATVARPAVVTRVAPTVTRALPLPPEFPEQAAPRVVEREQLPNELSVNTPPPNEPPPSEPPSNESEQPSNEAERENAINFLFFNALPRVAALAPGPIGVAARAASLANLFRRSAGSRPATPPPPPPQPNPWVNRQATDISSRFRRLFGRSTRRNNAAEGD